LWRALAASGLDPKEEIEPKLNLWAFARQAGKATAVKMIATVFGEEPATPA
jgi:hypothetical protein